MTLPDAKGTRTEKPPKEDREILLGTFDKNSTERVEIKLTTWKCQDYIDIRVFYTSNGKDYLPSKKGITLNVEVLPKLMQALEKADKVLKEEENK